MADVARLGLIVDATGAQREIKITREELIRLANGGKEASAALKSVGSPAVIQPLTQTTTVTRGATLEFGKMRGSLTQIAIAASGIPGPMGRLASVLSQFAFGGGVTVGVLAGLAAISHAWEKLTEKARKAKEEHQKTLDVLRALAKEQNADRIVSDATGQARRRMQEMRPEMADVNDRITGFRSRFESQHSLGNLRERRTALIKEYVELEALVRAGERRISEVQATGGQKAGTATTTPGIGRFSQEFWDGLSQKRIDAANRVAKAEEEAAERAKLAWEKAYTKQEKLVRQIEFALEDAGHWAIGKVAGAAGPFGGMVSGIGSNLLMGNAPGAAMAGVTGLVDGLMSLAASARQAREAARQWQLQFDSFMDQLRVEAGSLSSGEAGINAFKRQVEEQRRVLEAQLSIGTSGGPMGRLSQAEYDRIRKQLDDLNAAETEIIEKRRKEADQLERLNAAYRNAPTGFFVEKYLQQMGASPGTRAARPTGRSGGSPRSDASIVVNVLGTNDPQSTARAVIQHLQVWASVTDGDVGNAWRTLPVT